MKVGERIKERRKKLKISADELAKKLNVSRSTIFRYENGYIEKLPLDILEPIAVALQTTPQYLMGWEEVQKENDIITDAVIRMRKDMEFFSVVESLLSLNSEKLSGVKHMLAAFRK